MAGRTSQTPRRRDSSSTPARRSAAPRSRTPAKATKGATRATRPVRRSNPYSPLRLLGRGILALWMGLAHALGWLVRAIGRQAATARDLDPEHRRDGAGLGVLGLSVLLAAAVWFNSAGPVGIWL